MRHIKWIPLLFGLILASCSTATALPTSPPALPLKKPSLYLTVTHAPTASIPPTSRQRSQPSATPFRYLVVRGDTLGAIAQKHAIPLDALIAANPGLQPGLLSVGQELFIPASTSSLLLPTPAALPVRSAGCFPSGSGSWCAVLLENSTDQGLENISGELLLLDASGQRIETQSVAGLLNHFPPGQLIPLAARFKKMGVQVRLVLSSAMYVPELQSSTRVQNLLTEVAGSGVSARLTGRILQLAPTKKVWALAIAQNAAGQVVGLRRWESPDQVTDLLPFDFSIYSVGPAIERVWVIPEAQP